MYIERKIRMFNCCRAGIYLFYNNTTKYSLLCLLNCNEKKAFVVLDTLENIWFKTCLLQ